MDRLRERFLRLTQLQKTLVFGGLGLASGWATTGTLMFLSHWSRQHLNWPLIVAPGLVLGFVVLMPLTQLARDSMLRLLLATSVSLVIQPVVVVVMAGMGSLSRSLLGSQWVLFTGGILGGMAGALAGFTMAISSLPQDRVRNQRIAGLAIVGVGFAGQLASWAEIYDLASYLTRLLPQENLWRLAIGFVTGHFALAVCLSLREWPLAKVEVAD